MNRPNITITSNVYPVRKKFLFRDREFLRHIEGKEALVIANELLAYCERDMTDVQKKEFRRNRKCMHNADGDYTWGTVIRDGKKTMVCKCIKQDCHRFHECRPDFSKSELIHEDKNVDLIRQPETDIRDTDISGIEEPRFYRSTETDDSKAKGRSEKCGDQDDSAESKPVIPEEAQKDVEKETETGGFGTILKLIRGKKEDSSRKQKLPVRTEQKTERGKEVSGDTDHGIASLIDQQKVIQASPEEIILINAGPGTGKTYSLIEKLKYMTETYGLNPATDMLVLCFSRAAVAEIRTRINHAIENNEADQNLRALSVMTFDSFATRLLLLIDEDADLSGKDYDARIEMAAESIREYGLEYRHFIVDEIQDLVGIRAKLVMTILESIECGFTLLGDSCQSIYDWQVKDSDYSIDSKAFYRWLQERYEQCMLTGEYSENHRQCHELIEMTGGLRTELLYGNAATQINALRETFARADEIVPCHRINADNIKKNARTCFLCRKNGEVLELSRYLSHKGICHHVQRRSNEHTLQPWIAVIFGEYDNNVMNKESFSHLYGVLFPRADNEVIEEVWQHLKRIENRDTGDRIVISDLVTGLRRERNIHDSFYNSVSTDVIISTIHRAKGREYDNVVIVNNSFDRFLQDCNKGKTEKEITDEVKTYYVGFTRARNRVGKTSFKKIYVFPAKFGDERWYGKAEYNYYKRRPKLTHIEVGRQRDIEKSSFLSSSIFESYEKAQENQEYILDKVRKGDELTLLAEEDGFGRPVYYIYHGKRVIGKMSQHFSGEIMGIMREVYNAHDYYPKEINEVYVDEIVTYTHTGVTGSNVRLHSTNKIWNGVSVRGFGNIEWESLY